MHFWTEWTLVVENGPLLAEILVRYPDMAESIKSSAHHLDTISWVFRFGKNSLYPNDIDTQLMDYAEIELGLTPSPPGYRNPFGREAVGLYQFKAPLGITVTLGATTW